MKRTITIVIIILVALGFGYFLFKISPEQPAGSGGWAQDFNLSDFETISQPKDISFDDHILGNPEAKNVLVEYGDLQCPACAAFEPTLKQLPDQLKDTKVVFRHLPLNIFSADLHPNSIPAAYAAEAASAQGKFWDWKFLAYEKQAEWSNLIDPIDKFVEYAQIAGVADLNKFRSDITNKTYKDKLQKDISESLGLKVESTPTLYFNGTKISSGDINSIKSQVEQLYK